MADTSSPVFPTTTEGFVEYLQDSRFNQTFQLPADPSRGRSEPFHVSYADFGFRKAGDGSNADGGEGGTAGKTGEEEEHVLLWFGPLLATRMLHVAKDAMAKRHKVRIVQPDRPGFGGTDEVPSEKLLEMWRDVVPALLKHLNIAYVSLGCQSGGTVYAFDTILHNPQILHPSRPYIAIGSPWIHPSHTKVTTMAIVNALPAGMLGWTDKIASFVNSKVDPVTGFSSLLFDNTKKWMLGDDAAGQKEGRNGPEAVFEEELKKTLLEKVFREGVKGLSFETKLLMQRLDAGPGWAEWRDYDTLFPLLAGAVKEGRAKAGGHHHGGEGEDEEVKLRMDIFFAEEDSMIGNAGSQGPKWLEACWKKEVDEGHLEGEVTVVKGAEHETVWDMRWEAAEVMMKRVAGGE